MFGVRDCSPHRDQDAEGSMCLRGEHSEWLEQPVQRPCKGQVSEQSQGQDLHIWEMTEVEVEMELRWG